MPRFAALAKVVRVHSGDEFEAADFPTLEDGKRAQIELQRANEVVDAAYTLKHTGRAHDLHEALYRLDSETPNSQESPS